MYSEVDKGRFEEIRERRTRLEQVLTLLPMSFTTHENDADYPTENRLKVHEIVDRIHTFLYPIELNIHAVFGDKTAHSEENLYTDSNGSIQFAVLDPLLQISSIIRMDQAIYAPQLRGNEGRRFSWLGIRSKPKAAQEVGCSKAIICQIPGLDISAFDTTLLDTRIPTGTFTGLPHNYDYAAAISFDGRGRIHQLVTDWKVNPLFDDERKKIRYTLGDTSFKVDDLSKGINKKDYRVENGKLFCGISRVDLEREIAIAVKRLKPFTFSA